MAKRSRRSRRRQVSEKPKIDLGVPTTPSAPVSPAPEVVASESTNGGVVDFASEYFYVYQELRNVLIITVLMLIIMFALSFVI